MTSHDGNKIEKSVFHARKQYIEKFMHFFQAIDGLRLRHKPGVCQSAKRTDFLIKLIRFFYGKKFVARLNKV